MRALPALMSALLLMPGHALAQDAPPSGRDLFQKMSEEWNLSDSWSRATMAITGSGGDTRSRIIATWQKKNAEGRRMMLLRFEDPADVRGTGFLSIETGEDTTDQFLHIPAFNKTKRIASSQKAEKFMGSDFSYEDLQPRDIDDGEHLWLRTEKVFDIECDVVETRDEDGESQYGKVETWIRRDNHLPFQLKMYDRKGELLKHLKMLKFDIMDGRPVILKMRMENVREKTNTVISVDEIKLNQGLADDLFTQRSLEKPL